MKQRQKLIVLSGPTAVGKSEVSIALAKVLGGEVISADSQQLYRGMDIGTAKIRPQEMQGIPHHLIDCLDPSENMDVLRFQTMAKEAAAGIWSRGRIPIVVGGTGFYIQALLYDIQFTEEGGNPERRKELETLAKQQGPEALHALLAQLDPVSAEKIHANNIKRTIRAIEFCENSKQRISEHNQEQRRRESPYDFFYFALTDERQAFYERINRRVHTMMDAGLLEEARGFYDQICAGRLSRHSTAMQAIGYRELFAYFDGEYSLEEAVAKIQQNSRHYAKRQLTWLGREQADKGGCVEFLDIRDYGRDLEQVAQALAERVKRRWEIGEAWTRI